jgi:16S rRNA (cytidine1402-2'-O)-methyltransferase
MSSQLFLIPTSLGDSYDSIPSYVKNHCQDLNIFIVENIKSARRYLRKIGYDKNFDHEVVFFELDKHHFSIESLYNFLLENQNAAIGLLSEAGDPCIADPGATVVKIAHELKMKVNPLVGPSSILLALIGSGFNGQQFTFHGYLPIDKKEQQIFLKKLEAKIKKTGYTQIFMETPYRNEKTIEQILKTCHDDHLLCIAADLTLETECIETRKVGNWKKGRPNFHKRPAMFLLGN